MAEGQGTSGKVGEAEVVEPSPRPAGVGKGGMVPPEAHRWKKGVSGNPKGRPKGTGYRQLVAREKRLLERELQREGKVADSARSLLQSKSVQVVQEILEIALAPSTETRKKDKKTGEIIVTREPSQNKVKCLLAILDRLVPALKVVEVKDDGDKRVQEMSDQEIMDMMARMVELAQGGGVNQLPGDDHAPTH